MAPSDRDDDFAPEELAMLRSFFRDEAHETLERLIVDLMRTPSTGPGPELIGDLMRTTHTLKGSAGTVGLPEVVELSHQLEEQFARLRAGRLSWSAEVLDRLVECADALRAVIDAMDDATSQQQAAARTREQLQALAAIGARDGEARPPRSRRTSTQPGPDAGGGAVVAPYQGRDETTHTVVDIGAVPGRTRGELSGAYFDGASVLRVDPQRVDRLMDSVGELVFDRTRIERRVQYLRDLARDLGETRQRLRDQVVAARRGELDSAALADALADVEAELADRVTELARASAALLDDADALRRTSSSLQDGLTKVRMLKARSLFERLAPPLRAIARGAGKRIRFTTSGDDTEFDKTVAERITDPLIQLLRNAVAHGIEPSDERVRHGKPAEGEIRVAARQERGLLVLDVTDDGAGIEPTTLRRRLVASGRWSRTRAEVASDEEVLRSIFDAGVSIRDRADQLAGRGVGLDAVRETIARLGGEIRMTSTVGAGTTFTMRLPVSTAVSHALLFKVHGHVYALPNVHVVETAQLELDAGRLPADLEIRDERVPVLSLHAILDERAPLQARTAPAVVAEFAGKRFALSCDKIVGPREIVVKHLGPLLSPLPLYAGATISGSGKVQLILDPASLARIAYPGSEPSHPQTALEVGGTAPTPLMTMPERRAGRALIADDSRSIREAMTHILASAGYIVDVAEDGEAAWKMVRELRYDLLVTDLEMPNLDGFGLIRQVRDDETLRPLPVVVITSKATDEHRKQAEALGVIDLVPKPVTRRKILDALSRVG